MPKKQDFMQRALAAVEKTVGEPLGQKKKPKKVIKKSKGKNSSKKGL